MNANLYHVYSIRTGLVVGRWLTQEQAKERVRVLNNRVGKLAFDYRSAD